MFERFTDRARRVLVLGQEEARTLGHNFLGTEHLLLGLVREGDGVAAIALDQLGIRLDDVREKVKESIGPAGSATAGSPPFTPRAKKVLELSLREALQLGHNYIGTEHILLGLVREGEGVAAQVLVGLGADLSGVRQQVIELLAGNIARPVREGARGARPPAPVAFPVCSRCGANLSASARYRLLEVPPADAEPGRDPLRAAVVYCSQCGTVLGPYVEAGAHFPRLITGVVRGSSGGDIRPPRSRRFPDDLLAPVDLGQVPEDARVELVYRDNEVIEGTAGGKEVRLAGLLGSHRGPVDGTWGGVPVNANWRVGDNSKAPGPVPAILTGHFGEDAFKLKGDFRLAPNYFFEGADIAGELGGLNFHAEVSAADGGLGPTGAVVAVGTVGDAPLELFAALSGDLTKAVVRGSIGAHSISLDASRDQLGGAVKLYGSISGPPALVALTVGALTYFF